MAGDGDKPPWGFLANIKLVGVAAADNRLTAQGLSAFSILASHANQYGICSLRIQTIADRLGAKRQAISRVLMHVERCGYFSSERKWHPDGSEGAKDFKLNQELEGAIACPFRFDRPDLHDKRLHKSAFETTSRPDKSARVQHRKGAPPATSDRCSPCNKETLHPVQHLDVAHKRSLEEINKEEMSRSSWWSDSPVSADVEPHTGQQRDDGTNAGQQVEPIARQGNTNLPTSGTREASDQEDWEHYLDRRRQAAERLWRDWWALDPDLSLLDELGRGGRRVWPYATEKETERPGQGKKYLAGAIQRATRGEIKATDILAGLHRQPDTSSSM